MCVLEWYEVGPPPVITLVGAATGGELVKTVAGRVTPRYRACRVGGTSNNVSRHPLARTTTVVGRQLHRKLCSWLMTNPCGFLTSSFSLYKGQKQQYSS